jgi:hypothetical protein
MIEASAALFIMHRALYDKKLGYVSNIAACKRDHGLLGA